MKMEEQAVCATTCEEPGKRRCKRLKLEEKGVIQFDDESYEVNVLSLSPLGALIDFGDKAGPRAKDKFKLSIRPGGSILLLHFEGEVVRCTNNLVVVRFVPIK